MAKSHDAKKTVKKEPILTPKEKKAAKLAKKAKRTQLYFFWKTKNTLIKSVFCFYNQLVKYKIRMFIFASHFNLNQNR